MKILINQLQADLKFKMDKLFETLLNQQAINQSNSPTNKKKEKQVLPQSNQYLETQNKQLQSLPKNQEQDLTSTKNQASQLNTQTSTLQQQHRFIIFKTTFSLVVIHSIKQDITLLDHDLSKLTQQDILEAIKPFINFARSLLQRNKQESKLSWNSITILKNSCCILRKYLKFKLSFLDKIENPKFVPHNKDIIEYLYKVQSIYNAIFIHGRKKFDENHIITVQEIKQPDDGQQKDTQRNWKIYQKATQALLEQFDSFSENDENEDEYGWEDY